MLGQLIERACVYREMARAAREKDLWEASDSLDGKASGLFAAVRELRRGGIKMEEGRNPVCPHCGSTYHSSDECPYKRIYED